MDNGEAEGPRFQVGDDVRLLSQPDRAGRITGPPQCIQGEYWYVVYFGPGQSGRHPESDLEPYAGTFDVLQLLRDGRFAGREAFSKRLTYLKLARSLRSHVYALQASRTTFYPYQFKPLLKFLDSWKHRLLIADEVGLGKTIEAGLILTELRARLDLTRVLVVSPAHLITKWQQEMRRRFGLDFEVLTRARSLEFLNDFERDGEAVRLFGIASLQTLRGRSLQERWEAVAPTFDIVIFDEAGRLRNQGTLSNKAAALVGEGADGILLLTATPTQTGERDLFSLLNLLDPDDFGDFDLYRDRLQANEHVLEAMRLVRGGAPAFPEAVSRLRAATGGRYGARLADNPLFGDICGRLEDVSSPSRRELVELQRDLNSINLFGHILSRTRRREIDEARPVRQAFVVGCEPSPAEAHFYDVVTTLCRRAYESASGNIICAFAVMMPQRQMASCMPAMVAYVKERLARGDWAIGGEEDSDLSLDDWETDQEDDNAGRLDWSALGDLDERARELEASDSKWVRLLEVLKRVEAEEPGAKIVVFSFFKRTLAYLKRRLDAAGIQSLVISGDVPTTPADPETDERGRRLEQFKSDAAIRVLLSTEVGNEGLDLQFGHTLVNYDLPWNPMVVEQRIGRLDRIGQKSPFIRIFNLTMPGTIEDLMLERLYGRIKIFENSVGDLEDILGEVIRELTLELFRPDLTPEQQEARIEMAADAIEQKRLHQQALEARVASLIGHDEFFADEIARVKDSRRYVTPEELLLFVRDYLRAHHSNCHLEQSESGVWTLDVNEDLRWFVKRAAPPDDPGWLAFQRRSVRGTVNFTVDADIAQDRPQTELLAFHHPLVRAIAKYYAEHATELHPVSWLRVEPISDVPAGRYLWLMYLTEITGARAGRDIDFIAVNVETLETLPEDACDGLLWAMLARATSVPPGELYASAVCENVLQLADGAVVERLNRRFAEQRKLNESTVAGRLTSLDEAYRRQKHIREERLELARSRNRAPHYIRMLEGGLRNLATAYAQKRRELEAQRRLGRSLTVEGAGIVEVARA